MDSKALRLGMACVALLGLVACGGNNPPVILIDGGGGGTDSGSPGPVDGGPRPDTGTPDTCPAASYPAPTAGAVCAAATATCIEGATTQAEYDACLAADPMQMACEGCLGQEVISTCSESGVCDEEFGEVVCCLQEECPAGSPATCQQGALGAGGACAGDFDTFATCANAAAGGGQCGNTDFCFMGAATGFFADYGRAQRPFFPGLIRATSIAPQN